MLGGFFVIRALKAMNYSHMGIKERNLLQRIPCDVGEFFDALEAQLRIKKSVAALAHSDKVYHAKL